LKSEKLKGSLSRWPESFLCGTIFFISLHFPITCCF